MRILRLPGIHHDANAILVVGSDSTMLVDVGTSWYQLLVEERVRGKLLEGEIMDRVLLTCRRFNHAGGAAHIGEAFSVPVFMHPNGSQAVSSGDFFTTWSSRFDSDFPPLETEAVVDGHNWDLGDGTLEVIETPGHSNDAIAAWIPEKGVLVAGPTIPKADAPARWDQPLGCLPDLATSIEKLLDLEIKSLVPAHGETIRGTEVKKMLQRHLDFFTEVENNDGVMPKKWPRPARTCNHLTPRPAWPELGQKKKDKLK
jgi:glyoxylase-like metal-dependent hydrolase (beta-lactamase superfamily II)